MGYQLNAFVAKRGTFDHYKTLASHITVAPLNQGFDMLLNDWNLLEYVFKPKSINEPEGFDGMDLYQEVIEMAERISHTIPIAYVYIDFFGGNGEQRSVVWKDGKIVLKPANNGWIGSEINASSPVNAALRAIGVQVGETDDEFVAIGFKRHRHMEDWFVEYTPFEADDYFPPGYGT